MRYYYLLADTNVSPCSAPLRYAYYSFFPSSKKVHYAKTSFASWRFISPLAKAIVEKVYLFSPPAVPFGVESFTFEYLTFGKVRPYGPIHILIHFLPLRYPSGEKGTALRAYLYSPFRRKGVRAKLSR